MASKVAPYPTTDPSSLQVLNMSQRTNDSAASASGAVTPSKVQEKSESPRDSQRSEGSGSRNMSKMKGGITIASVGVAQRKVSNRTDPASLNNSTIGAVDFRSGRGHDLDGGGLHVGHGQLEQAKDRNFQAVLDRCRVATNSLAALRPVVCVATCGELQQLGASPPPVRPFMREVVAPWPSRPRSPALVTSCRVAFRAQPRRWRACWRTSSTSSTRTLRRRSSL